MSKNRREKRASEERASEEVVKQVIDSIDRKEVPNITDGSAVCHGKNQIEFKREWCNMPVEQNVLPPGMPSGESLEELSRMRFLKQMKMDDIEVEMVYDPIDKMIEEMEKAPAVLEIGDQQIPIKLKVIRDEEP